MRTRKRKYGKKIKFEETTTLFTKLRTCKQTKISVVMRENRKYIYAAGIFHSKIYKLPF